MSLLVVGSVALDSVETPFGRVDEVLGGSATFSSTAASIFTPVRIVAVVGDDFPVEHRRFLEARRIDTRGLATRPGRTFRWRGRYGENLDQAETLSTDLGVFADFRPEIPPEHRSSSHIFLGNIDPELQLHVLRQLEGPRVVALDTMNFWITGKPEALKRVLARVDVFIINEEEARMLSGRSNLLEAAEAVRALGPSTLVVKRGQYGAMLFGEEGMFALPAFPLRRVADPTGAGDSFAGGFMGFLAGAGRMDADTLAQALAVGSVVASYNVEEFSLRRLQGLGPRDIVARYDEFMKLTRSRPPDWPSLFPNG